MSDLQCPATLLVLGRAGWPSHVPVPHDRNVAVVYCPSDEVEVAAELADTLEAALRPVRDLMPPQATVAGSPQLVDLELDTASDPAGEAGGSGEEWDDTWLRASYDAIADLHRGETVIVVTPTDEPGHELRIDADGWATGALA